MGSAHGVLLSGRVPKHERTEGSGFLFRSKRHRQAFPDTSLNDGLQRKAADSDSNIVSLSQPETDFKHFRWPVIYFPMPNEELRHELWKNMLPQTRPEEQNNELIILAAETELSWDFKVDSKDMEGTGIIAITEAYSVCFTHKKL